MFVQKSQTNQDSIKVHNMVADKKNVIAQEEFCDPPKSSYMAKIFFCHRIAQNSFLQEKNTFSNNLT